MAAALLALLAGCGGPAAAPLPALKLDGQRVAVLGLSSGGYMAGQVHAAYSDRLVGVAILAAGPPGCAEGKLETALGPCLLAKPEAPDAARLAARLRERAAAGELAPLSGFGGDRIYLLHGAADAVVSPDVGRSAAAFYRGFADVPGGLLIKQDGGRRIGHVFPTMDTGVDCVAGGSPYLGNCGFDAAGEALAWLFGAPAKPADDAHGELRRFDQDVYREEGGDPLLAAEGFLYLPPACAAGETCGLLIAFHGCQQDASQVGEAFVRDAGLNRWADVHRLAVLYPQTRSSYLPLNPKACWDWWGYTGPDYDTRRGAQLRWLAAASKALGVTLDPGTPLPAAAATP